jgi:hypothetical protein
MPRSRKKTVDKDTGEIKRQNVSLKELGAHLGLSPTALSIVLNDAPAASTIPQETKNRIFAAAQHLITARIISRARCGRGAALRSAFSSRNFRTDIQRWF